MDPYCLYFSSIVTSCWHIILWSWLHVVTQIILEILSLLVQSILLMINNDLCYFHLPAVLKFICLPKTSIYYRMCYWWMQMPTCSVIRLTPLSNTRWIKFVFWWCWPSSSSINSHTGTVWLFKCFFDNLLDFFTFST